MVIVPSTLTASEAPLPLEVEVAVVEIVVGHAERRGDEAAADLHGAGRRDRNPVGVDEIDLAVGVELARDRRGGRSGDAVEDRRAGVRLGEGDAGAGADREAVPVDDRALRRSA